MPTISFSVEESIKKDIERLAQKTGRSKSDVFRDIYAAYSFRQSLAGLQRYLQPKALKLGIQSDDDVERLLG